MEGACIIAGNSGTKNVVIESTVLILEVLECKLDSKFKGSNSNCFPKGYSFSLNYSSADLIYSSAWASFAYHCVLWLRPPTMDQS